MCRTDGLIQECDIYLYHEEKSPCEEFGIFHVISACCATDVPQNAEISWKTPRTTVVRAGQLQYCGNNGVGASVCCQTVVVCVVCVYCRAAE